MTWQGKTAIAAAAVLIVSGAAVRTSGGAPPGPRARSLSPHLREAVDLGREHGMRRHRIVVALELRNREALDAFLADVQDPASPRYRQFLTQAEFDALYAPAPADEEAVVAHLRRHGLRVTSRAPNRLLIGATGNVAAIEEAFGVEMHRVQFRGALRYAALSEPSLPPEIADRVVGVVGLDDLHQMRAHVRSPTPVPAPDAALGSSCCHLSPNDLATLYDQPPGVDGTGQTVVIAGAYAWKSSDNSSFNSRWGLPALPSGSAQVCTKGGSPSSCKFSSKNSIEIALDAEYAHGTAPGARILNYMSGSTSFADFTVLYNRIVTDNPGHVVTTSWGACEAGISAATQRADDNIFANANAIGQSWLAASGDAGSRDCNNLLTVDDPANSPHVIGVGGTTPACGGGMTSSSPACGGYGSETGWSGSGGGVSQLFARPSFQSGCGISPGSQRLVPDVALEADTAPGNYVVENGTWYTVGGTSGAAPQWAAFLAQFIARSGAPLGNPGALLYGACGTAAFHDVTSGSNGDYAAGPLYDLVTGIGSIEARNFLALASAATTTTTAPAGTTSSSSTTSTSSTTSSSTQPSSTSTTSSTVSTVVTSTATSSSTSVSSTSSTSSSLSPTTSTSATSSSSSTSSTSTSSSSTSTSSSQAPTTSSSSTTTPVTSTSTTSLPAGGVNTYQGGVSGPAGSANVDTNIRLDTSSTNWGTDVNLYVGVTNGPTKVFRTIMAFNLSDIPAGATVTGCTLTVNVTQRTSPTVGHVRQLCSDHWLDGDAQSETQATWSLWKTGASWATAGAGAAGVCGSGVDYTTTNEIAYTPPGGTGAFTFPDLSPLCQNAIVAQGGWLRLRISQDAESTQGNLIKFDSSDAGTTTTRPKLSVSWR